MDLKPVKSDITRQLPDTIKYKSKLYELGNEPFADYLAEHFPDVKLDITMEPFQRGYIGKWALKRGKLFLTALDAMCIEGMDIEMDYFFGTDDPVFVDWFTGTLRLMDDPTFHTGYSTGGRSFVTYEREFYLKVVNGVVQDGGKEYSLKDLMIRIEHEKPKKK